MELSNISNSKPDNELENKMIDNYCECGVEVDHSDIEGFYGFTVSTHTWGDDKRVIVNFVNKMHSEAFFNKKRSIGSRDLSNNNIPSKIFVSTSLYLYYQLNWGKCKDLQRRGKNHQVFRLSGTLLVGISKSGNPVKTFHVNDVSTLDDEEKLITRHFLL